MFSRRSVKQDSSGSNVPKPETPQDMALAAIMPFKKQQDVSDFISFVLETLDRNAHWINSLLGRQNGFKCAIMTGCGPNRFQIHQIIYPVKDQSYKFQLECTESEDHDKVAVAALLKLNNIDMERIMKCIKTRLFEHSLIREELCKGKLLGVSYAVLQALTDVQYRLMDRIIIGSSMKCAAVKRSLVDRSVTRNIVKKAKRVV